STWPQPGPDRRPSGLSTPRGFALRGLVRDHPSTILCNIQRCRVLECGVYSYFHRIFAKAPSHPSSLCRADGTFHKTYFRSSTVAYRKTIVCRVLLSPKSADCPQVSAFPVSRHVRY